jgi:2-aminoadipate transaminase
MSPARRSQLAGLAARHRVPVIEDDAYGFLHYGESPTPPLRALEEQWVFYVGSFSKILAPSLRVGWVIVPEAFIHQLSIFKEASDINTATLTQRAISTFLEQNILSEHIALLNREYGARRDAMLDALHQSFPRGASWRVPQSGVFIWVELPGEPDMLGLLAKAIEEEKIAFIPGQAFYVGSRKQISSAMRLNFSNSSVERIADGISRLGRLVQRACA